MDYSLSKFIVIHNRTIGQDTERIGGILLAVPDGDSPNHEPKEAPMNKPLVPFSLQRKRFVRGPVRYPTQLPVMKFTIIQHSSSS